MVSQMSFIGMGIQLLFGIVLPVAVYLYLRKKQLVSWKAIGVGILTFVVFSQILEKVLHFVMLNPDGISLKWTSNPYIFALYGGLAAGIFEEVGRYLAFKLLLRKRHSYKDGLSYGLGHGGIEVILVCVLMALNSFIMATLINTGMFDSQLGAKLPADQLHAIKDQIINHGIGFYLLSSFERIPAFCIHLFLSLVVLLGVKRNKLKYLFLAIGIHALIDCFPALYQVGIIKSMVLLELIVFASGLICFLFIKRIKIEFEKEEAYD